MYARGARGVDCVPHLVRRVSRQHGIAPLSGTRNDQDCVLHHSCFTRSARSDDSAARTDNNGPRIACTVRSSRESGAVDPANLAVRFRHRRRDLRDAVSPLLTPPMPRRRSPRAFWLLIALAVLGPPIISFVLHAPPDLLRGVVQRIPEPQPVVIRPHLFVAYGALIAACTLAILYLYRGRGFVVYWIISWTMLAASYTLNARGYEDVLLGSVMIGLSELLAVWSSALILLSVPPFAKRDRERWSIPVQAGAATAVWFLVSPFVVSLPTVLYTGGAMSALLRAFASARFARVARLTPIVGAFMLSAALGVMSVLDAIGAVMAYRQDWNSSYANALLAFTIVMSIVIALGMHLLVFEDMTDEIRRTNLALAVANKEVKRLAITDPLNG